mgnify:FL=1
MKTNRLIVLFLVLLMTPVLYGQNILYSTYSDLLSNEGDTIKFLIIEKRSKGSRLSVGGVDYRISDPERVLNKYLRTQCLAVKSSNQLYLNCRNLRYNKMKFGRGYAPAFLINQYVYFTALPIGSVAGSSTSKKIDIKLGGELGDALASAGMVDERVFYRLNLLTGKTSFVCKKTMCDLLEDYPEKLTEFLNESSLESSCLKPYLYFLQKGSLSTKEGE